MNAVDLFAGPGGLDLGADALGIDVVGVELDEHAVQTRKAARLNTVQGNVAELDPLDFAPVDGLMGGPPCPTFSMAGKGSGRDDLTLLQRAIYQLSRGNDAWRETAAQCKDKRTPLVLEPLRWAIALKPTWIVLEQVPPVLPIWEMTAIALQAQGYNVWTGLLSAEQYGVPQTRRRAILLASRDRPVGPPAPTHQRYEAKHPRSESLCGGLKPWVSMAEALGWGMTERPCVTVASRKGNGGGAGIDGGSGSRRTVAEARDRGQWRIRLPGGGSRGTERDASEPAPTIAVGKGPNDIQWLPQAMDRRQQRDRNGTPVPPRSVDEPAPTISGQSRNDKWTGVERVEMRRGGDRIEEGVDPHAAPAPTVTTRTNRWQGVERSVEACGCLSEWVDEGGFCACCQAHLDDPAGLYAQQGDGSHSYEACPAREQRPDWTGERPAPTIVGGRRSDRGMLVGKQLEPGEGRNVGGRDWAGGSRPGEWEHARPATTIAGDGGVVQPPGHKINASDVAAGRTDYNGRNGRNATRVTIEEASILQSFPPDYPWQGSRTAQYQQVGNAVPPLLAIHVIAAATGEPLPEYLADA